LAVLRYLVVGGIAFVVDFGVLVALKEISLLPLSREAAAVAFCLRLVTNYILSVTWVSAPAPWQHENGIRDLLDHRPIGLAGMSRSCTSAPTLWPGYRISKLITVAIVLIGTSA